MMQETRIFDFEASNTVDKASDTIPPDHHHHPSVAIEQFMQAWNHNPKPFIWTATVEDIIKKIERARLKMEQIKPGSTLPRGKKTATKL